MHSQKEVGSDESSTAYVEKPRYSETRPVLLHWVSQIWWLVQDQWFLCALGFFILLASQKQVSKEQQPIKETIVTYLCVSVIFFVTGCTLPTDVLVQNYSRWQLHLFCQLQSFLLTSAIAFCTVSICAIDPNFMDGGLLVGLILAGSVPTTISSNIVMTKQAGGNQALTVVQSTLGNFIGPLLTPPLVLMYLLSGAWYSKVVPSIDIDAFGDMYRRVLKQLGLSIFLPLFLGQMFRKVLPKLNTKLFTNWRLSKIGPVALLLIIWQTYDGAFESGAFDTVRKDNIIFLIFISITFYSIWTVICFFLSLLWLDREDAIAVAYIIPAKSAAVGVPLSEAIFAGLDPVTASKVQMPVVIYQGVAVLIGSILTLVFRSWLGSLNKKMKGVEDGTNTEDSDSSSH